MNKFKIVYSCSYPTVFNVEVYIYADSFESAGNYASLQAFAMSSSDRLVNFSVWQED